MKNKNIYLTIIFLAISFFYLNVITSKSGVTTIGVTPSIVVNKVTNSNGEINVELNILNRSKYKSNISENEKSKYDIKISFDFDKANSTIKRVEYSENNFMIKPGENKKVNIKAFSSGSTDNENIFYIDVIGTLNKKNSVELIPKITVPIYYIDNSNSVNPKPEPEQPDITEPEQPNIAEPEQPNEDIKDFTDDSEENLNNNLNPSEPNVTIQLSKENNFFNYSNTIDNLYNFFKNIIKNPIQTIKDIKNTLIENLFYKPIQISINDLMVYEIKKTRYNSLINTIIDNEKVTNKNVYTIIRGNKNFDLIVDDVEFTDKSVIFKSNDLKTELIFPTDSILISVKNQIRNIAEITEEKPSIRHLVENIVVPKDKNYQPIKIKSEAIIINPKERTILPVGESALIGKNNEVINTSDFSSKPIPPNETGVIYSEMYVDSSQIKKDIYKLKSSIQFSQDDDIIVEEKNIVFVSIRNFIYIAILISLFGIITLILNNIKRKERIDINHSLILNKYDKNKLNIQVYDNINTEFFNNYLNNKS